MKAKDLAVILLQNPELEVFTENGHSDRDGDWFYTASTVTGGFTITPSGLFLHHEQLRYDENCKIPSDSPRVGEARIKVKGQDFDFFPIETDYGSGDTDLQNGWLWTSLQNEGYYFSYMNWQENVLLIMPGVVYEEEYEGDYETVSTDDIEYVEILSTLNPFTWEETWVRMTFDEAMQYFINTQNN